MPNYFTDNPDILFQFQKLDLRRVTAILEHDYAQAAEYPDAPRDYDDAKENYYKVLEITGDLAGNYIAARAADVDASGALFENGKVSYAAGTQKNLKQLSQAGLMGMTIPRKYGGLHFPFTMYIMGIEIIARADASLMNIFGLQDIADTINKFGNEEQRAEYMPGFSEGRYTGAMALTEPDAGSDLQAVKLTAYQDEKGNWFLRGVKRFITNGNGEVLLVLARSEPGTKDGRGLSMFACYGDETVVVRRIEHKLGIHGSPTCELQFNDTPAQLVGQRKFGLIKYVLDLMYRARMGVSAQALGIMEAAYDEALKYAKDREQFGKPIYNIPVITNMLIDMRVAIESCRTLLYDTAYHVDLKERLEHHIEMLKLEKKPFTEEMAELKKITKWANFLTPVCKYMLSETSNKVTYDALQIHGGTGYMQEFNIERLARDARITNIYEGTSQLQVVAASGSVYNDIFAELYSGLEEKEYPGGLSRLSNHLKEIRILFLDALKYIADKKDTTFQELCARDMVEIYGMNYVGYKLLEEAEVDSRKVFIADRYIKNALSLSRKSVEAIKQEMFSDILHAEKILI